MTKRTPDAEMAERVEKLPAWAREYIRRLERRAADAEAKYIAQFDVQTPTRVTYGDHYQNPRFLPDRPTDSVRFTLPGSTDGRDDWIEMLPGGENVGYYGDPDMLVRASDGFAILPQSSNAIGIRLIRRP